MIPERERREWLSQYKMCSCGRVFPTAEAAFWGECDRCRLQLPIRSKSDIYISTLDEDEAWDLVSRVFIGLSE